MTRLTPPEDPDSLERFVAAQDGSYDIALAELKGGPETQPLDVVHLSAAARPRQVADVPPLWPCRA